MGGELDSLSTRIDNKVSKSGDRMSGDLTIIRADGTTTTVGNSTLTLGNNIQEGTAGNSRGYILMYGKSDKRVVIRDNNTNGFTANREINIPDASGTLALRTDALPVITRSLSTDSIVSCIVDSSHRAIMHVNLTSKQPTGYSLYKVSATIAWTNSNSWEAAKSELLGTSIRYYSESLTISDVEFYLYREAEQTVGSTYSPLNAYWICAEWLPSYLFN